MQDYMLTYEERWEIMKLVKNTILCCPSCKDKHISKAAVHVLSTEQSHSTKTLKVNVRCKACAAVLWTGSVERKCDDYAQ